MKDWLSARAENSPKSIGLIYKNQSWSFQQIDLLVNRMTQVLLKRGVESGQRIGVLIPNKPEFVILIYSIIRIKSILVPINLRLTPFEISKQMAEVKVSNIIYCKDTEKLINSLENSNIIKISLDMFFNSLINWMKPPIIPNDDQIIKNENFINLNDVQSILFTSGSTGKPKGVMISYKNIYSSAMASAYHLGTNPRDTWLLCLPLYHIGGLSIIFRCCLYGSTVILHEKFSPKDILSSLSNNRVSLISLVPTMLNKLLKEPSSNVLSSLRLILLGGAPASQSLINQASLLNLKIATTYGLTEAASQVATALPEHVFKKPKSVGKPLIFTSVKILDNQGKQTKSRKIGEIYISGPNVMVGYWKSIDSKGTDYENQYLATGDLGFLDEDGDLFVVQRRTDLIISGGENVYPSEIEEILLRHDKIEEVFVCGIASEEWGQNIVALIVTKNNQEFLQEEIIQFSRRFLSGFKIPKQIFHVKSLPRTSSGKIDRKKSSEIIKNYL